ncbi:MAG TPA: nucleotidyltransferase domain-containing protein [Candidatus Aminicenantes bacterium]|nr:nucleotidyltransferase domain-containing protein [Smithellaceae bacterium]HOI44885.1 nucleotidyltransferase domain-containing protein [Candidatus Aminicenantes bacterium]
MAQIDDSIKGTLENYLAKLERAGIRVEAAYLFGSFAANAQRNESDIDIAIVSPDLTGNRYEERVRLMEFSSDIDTRIEPVPFRPENFVDEDPLAWEIKKKGILIV